MAIRRTIKINITGKIEEYCEKITEDYIYYIKIIPLQERKNCSELFYKRILTFKQIEARTYDLLQFWETKELEQIRKKFLNKINSN